jgi:hypothetical protein
VAKDGLFPPPRLQGGGSAGDAGASSYGFDALSVHLATVPALAGQVDGLQVDGLQVDGLQVDGLQVDGLIMTTVQRRPAPFRVTAVNTWAEHMGVSATSGA